jgi:cell division protein ZipA
MDTLRWIILGAGVLLAIVVYLVSRHQRPRHRGLPVADEYEEDVSDVRLIVRAEQEETLDSDLSQELAALTDQVREEAAERPQPESAPVESPPPTATDTGAARPSKPSPLAAAVPKLGRGKAKAEKPARPEPELIIVLHVAAKGQGRVSGQALRDALEVAGLEFGEMDIYHRYSEVGGERRQLFSAANMIKPGTLRAQDLDGLQTPGLSLFMRLPGPLRPLDALDEMLAVAGRLAAEIDGQLLAENRIPLTRQLTEHMRDRVRAFSLEMERARH